MAGDDRPERALRPAFYYGSSAGLTVRGYKTVVEALQPYLGASVLDTLGVFPRRIPARLYTGAQFVRAVPAGFPGRHPDDRQQHHSGRGMGRTLRRSPVKNRGISSDVTDGIRARLPRMLRGKPRKVFLMAGINDLGNPPQKTPEYTLNNILETVRDIHRLSPGTQVYLQSILPSTPPSRPSARTRYSAGRSSRSTAAWPRKPAAKRLCVHRPAQPFCRCGRLPGSSLHQRRSSPHGRGIPSVARIADPLRERNQYEIRPCSETF